MSLLLCSIGQKLPSAIRCLDYFNCQKNADNKLTMQYYFENTDRLSICRAGSTIHISTNVYNILVCTDLPHSWWKFNVKSAVFIFLGDHDHICKNFCYFIWRNYRKWVWKTHVGKRMLEGFGKKTTPLKLHNHCSLISRFHQEPKKAIGYRWRRKVL